MALNLAFDTSNEAMALRLRLSARSNMFSTLSSIGQQSLPSQRIVRPILGMGFHS
jgi:hypothetical protein